MRDPDVFLFDEPLSNLDAELRVQMRLELSKLHRSLGATMVFVTHDQTEAMTLADRIVVMHDGNLEQVGTPIEVYNAPRNRFVAGFIGSPKMNFLTARVGGREGDRLRIEVPGMRPGEMLLPVGGSEVQTGDEVVVGVRPEHLFPGQAAPLALETRIEFIEQLGGVSYLYAPDHPAGAVVAKHDGSPTENPVGGEMSIGLRAELCHLFAADGETVPIMRETV